MEKKSTPALQNQFDGTPQFTSPPPQQRLMSHSTALGPQLPNLVPQPPNLVPQPPAPVSMPMVYAPPSLGPAMFVQTTTGHANPYSFSAPTSAPVQSQPQTQMALLQPMNVGMRQPLTEIHLQNSQSAYMNTGVQSTPVQRPFETPITYNTNQHQYQNRDQNRSRPRTSPFADQPCKFGRGCKRKGCRFDHLNSNGRSQRKHPRNSIPLGEEHPRNTLPSGEERSRNSPFPDKAQVIACGSFDQRKRSSHHAHCNTNGKCDADSSASQPHILTHEQDSSSIAHISTPSKGQQEQPSQEAKIGTPCQEHLWESSGALTPISTPGGSLPDELFGCGPQSVDRNTGGVLHNGTPVEAERRKHHPGKQSFAQEKRNNNIPNELQENIVHSLTSRVVQQKSLQFDENIDVHHRAGMTSEEFSTATKEEAPDSKKDESPSLGNSETKIDKTVLIQSSPSGTKTIAERKQAAVATQLSMNLEQNPKTVALKSCLADEGPNSDHTLMASAQMSSEEDTHKQTNPESGDKVSCVKHIKEAGPSSTSDSPVHYLSNPEAVSTQDLPPFKHQKKIAINKDTKTVISTPETSNAQTVACKVALADVEGKRSLADGVGQCASQTIVRDPVKKEKLGLISREKILPNEDEEKAKSGYLCKVPKSSVDVGHKEKKTKCSLLSSDATSGERITEENSLLQQMNSNSNKQQFTAGIESRGEVKDCVQSNLHDSAIEAAHPDKAEGLSRQVQTSSVKANAEGANKPKHSESSNTGLLQQSSNTKTDGRVQKELNSEETGTLESVHNSGICTGTKRCFQTFIGENKDPPSLQSVKTARLEQSVKADCSPTKQQNKTTVIERTKWSSPPKQQPSQSEKIAPTQKIEFCPEISGPDQNKTDPPEPKKHFPPEKLQQVQKTNAVLEAKKQSQSLKWQPDPNKSEISDPKKCSLLQLEQSRTTANAMTDGNELGSSGMKGQRISSETPSQEEAKGNEAPVSLWPKGLATCRGFLNRRLLDPRKTSVMSYLEEAKEKLVHTLRRCTLHGESGSCVLIGRDEGNCQTLLRAALSEIAKKKSSDGTAPPSKKSLSQERGFRLVRVDGRVQTDDVCAIKELARQLGVERASLKDSFVVNMQIVRRELRNSRAEGLPTLVILDAFGEFVNRPKQTLLYHLFDMTQGQDVHLFVIAITPELSSYMRLEKRVKSRFSGCKIFVKNNPSEFKVLYEHLQDQLTVPLEKFPGEKKYMESFNNNIKSLFKKAQITRMFKKWHSIGRDYSWFCQMLGTSVLLINRKHPQLRLSHLVQAANLLSPNLHRDVLRTLSVLELCIAICCKRLECRGKSCYVLPMLFSEYESFIRLQGKTTERFSRTAFTGAFHFLVDSRFLKLTNGQTSIDPRFLETTPIQLSIDPDLLTEALKDENFLFCPTAIREWGVKEPIRT